MILGIMQSRKEQNRAFNEEVALCSQAFDITVICMVPTDIDWKNNEVIGHYFINNEWRAKSFPCPHFVYDRAFYTNQTRYLLPLVNQFKKKCSATFINHGLPNKWKVHEYLLKTNLFHPYLPDTTFATLEVISPLLDVPSSYILKPIHGAAGRGIYIIEKKEKFFLIHHPTSKGLFSKRMETKRSLNKYLTTIFDKEDYIIQPTLPIRDENFVPFDIRLLLQKNEDGRWTERGRAIREGIQGSYLSNLAANGKLTNYFEWISKKSKVLQSQIECQIDYISSTLPTMLEKEYGLLFELGLDFGVTKEGNVFLLDINSKPGHKTAIFSCLDPKKIYEAPLRYCLHLNKNKEVLAL
ncbi:YheC/YheD family protein [Bacillus carboniphilus]|uniref:YheC/YheD family protein n=1 Tax=Bacillus carboniphilus TaxID=86663 RepID=A0ABY9JTT7_9BACI|nr:YheC/YheD family protein [Bacillus carboniphilus]WLR42804.1 YheC/YheD family protein [Bacillus carboniphilus]